MSAYHDATKKIARLREDLQDSVDALLAEYEDALDAEHNLRVEAEEKLQDTEEKLDRAIIAAQEAARG